MTCVLSIIQMLVIPSFYGAAASLFCACLVNRSLRRPVGDSRQGYSRPTHSSSSRRQCCFWTDAGVSRMQLSLPSLFVVSLCPGSLVLSRVELCMWVLWYPLSYSSLHPECLTRFVQNYGYWAVVLLCTIIIWCHQQIVDCWELSSLSSRRCAG